MLIRTAVKRRDVTNLCNSNAIFIVPSQVPHGQSTKLGVYGCAAVARDVAGRAETMKVAVCDFDQRVDVALGSRPDELLECDAGRGCVGHQFGRAEGGFVCWIPVRMCRLRV
jgi:hypothetical protein